MNRISPILFRLFGLILIIANSLLEAAAQSSQSGRERSFIDSAADRYWYTLFAVLCVVVIGGFVLWRRSRRQNVSSAYSYSERLQAKQQTDSMDDDSVDVEKELEWFRNAKRPSKVEVRTGTERRKGQRRDSDKTNSNGKWSENELDSKALQDKMKKLHFAQLPINSFVQLTDARGFEPLQISSDPALLSAIEQANEEFEDDETVRELAVKILAAFRSRNSVEALSQIALYDLSSNLRSKAVAILMDFDHESVFETILLACADPTREVRAAAARGLFRLSFDRAEAWKRLIDTKDEFRMRHAARAAVESGIVQKSFDRLIHEDMRVAYEAFALVGLLIKSGETDSIFKAIVKHPDDRIKLALIHVLKVVKDERALARLEDLSSGKALADEMAHQAAVTVKDIAPVAMR
jgi:hypothetical protein